jgi:hypothetical protein
MGEKILQLVPAAPGWRIGYVAGGKLEMDDVACWALVETEAGDQKIMPVTRYEGAELQPEDSDNTLVVLGPSADEDELQFWRDAAAKRAEK